MRKAIVFPGQKVITTGGNVVTVAYVSPHDIVYAFDRRGIPVPVSICGDAWGGEVDQTLGLAA